MRILVGVGLAQQVIKLLGCIVILTILAILYTMIFNKKKRSLSFRQAFALSGLPIISFKSNDQWINLVFDTGCNYSVINKEEVDKFNCILLEGASELIGLEGKTNRGNVAKLTLEYEDEQYTIECGVIDMSEAIKELKNTYGVIVHGILGTDFFDKYKYVIDFRKMIAYSQKV